MQALQYVEATVMPDIEFSDLIVLIIFAKIGLVIFWVLFGWVFVMISVMAFDAPGSEKKFVNHIPMIISVAAALASLYFLIFVW